MPKRTGATKAIMNFLNISPNANWEQAQAHLRGKGIPVPSQQTFYAAKHRMKQERRAAKGKNLDGTAQPADPVAALTEAADKVAEFSDQAERAEVRVLKHQVEQLQRQVGNLLSIVAMLTADYGK